MLRSWLFRSLLFGCFSFAHADVPKIVVHGEDGGISTVDIRQNFEPVPYQREMSDIPKRLEPSRVQEKKQQPKTSAPKRESPPQKITMDEWTSLVKSKPNIWVRSLAPTEEGYLQFSIGNQRYVVTPSIISVAPKTPVDAESKDVSTLMETMGDMHSSYIRAPLQSVADVYEKEMSIEDEGDRFMDSKESGLTTLEVVLIVLFLNFVLAACVFFVMRWRRQRFQKQVWFQ